MSVRSASVLDLEGVRSRVERVPDDFLAGKVCAGESEGQPVPHEAAPAMLEEMITERHERAVSSLETAPPSPQPLPPPCARPPIPRYGGTHDRCPGKCAVTCTYHPRKQEHLRESFPPP